MPIYNQRNPVPSSGTGVSPAALPSTGVLNSLVERVSSVIDTRSTERGLREGLQQGIDHGVPDEIPTGGSLANPEHAAAYRRGLLASSTIEAVGNVGSLEEEAGTMLADPAQRETALDQFQTRIKEYAGSMPDPTMTLAVQDAGDKAYGRLSSAMAKIVDDEAQKAALTASLNSQHRLQVGAHFSRTEGYVSSSNELVMHTQDVLGDPKRAMAIQNSVAEQLLTFVGQPVEGWTAESGLPLEWAIGAVKETAGRVARARTASGDPYLNPVDVETAQRLAMTKLLGKQLHFETKRMASELRLRLSEQAARSEKPDLGKEGFRGLLLDGIMNLRDRYQDVFDVYADDFDNEANAAVSNLAHVYGAEVSHAQQIADSRVAQAEAELESEVAEAIAYTRDFNQTGLFDSDHMDALLRAGGSGDKDAMAAYFMQTAMGGNPSALANRIAEAVRSGDNANTIWIELTRQYPSARLLDGAEGDELVQYYIEQYNNDPRQFLLDRASHNGGELDVQSVMQTSPEAGDVGAQVIGNLDERLGVMDQRLAAGPHSPPLTNDDKYEIEAVSRLVYNHPEMTLSQKKEALDRLQVMKDMNDGPALKFALDRAVQDIKVNREFQEGGVEDLMQSAVDSFDSTDMGGSNQTLAAILVAENFIQPGTKAAEMLDEARMIAILGSSDVMTDIVDLYWSTPGITQQYIKDNYLYGGEKAIFGGLPFELRDKVDGRLSDIFKKINDDARGMKERIEGRQLEPLRLNIKPSTSDDRELNNDKVSRMIQTFNDNKRTDPDKPAVSKWMGVSTISDILEYEKTNEVVKQDLYVLAAKYANELSGKGTSQMETLDLARMIGKGTGLIPVNADRDLANPAGVVVEINTLHDEIRRHPGIALQSEEEYMALAAAVVYEKKAINKLRVEDGDEPLKGAELSSEAIGTVFEQYGDYATVKPRITERLSR